MFHVCLGARASKIHVASRLVTPHKLETGAFRIADFENRTDDLLNISSRVPGLQKHTNGSRYNTLLSAPSWRLGALDRWQVAMRGPAGLRIAAALRVALRVRVPLRSGPRHRAAVELWRRHRRMMASRAHGRVVPRRCRWHGRPGRGLVHLLVRCCWRGRVRAADVLHWSRASCRDSLVRCLLSDLCQLQRERRRRVVRLA